VNGPLLLLTAAVLWGTAGTAATLGAPDADPSSVAAVRLVGGGLLLAAATAGRTLGVARVVVRGARGRGELGWAAASVAAVVGYQVFFFQAVAAVGVARGTLVALGSAPVLTGALAWAATGRRPGARWAVATGVAVAGLVLLVGTGGSGVAAAWPAVAAGACYAVYAVGSGILVRSGLPAGGVMGLLFGAGALALVPVLAAAPPTWVATAEGAMTAAYLAVATLALAYLLFGYALRRISAAEAATLSLAEPATAALLGVAVLGESIAPAGVAGVALLAVGLVLAAIPGRAGPSVRDPVAGSDGSGGAAAGHPATRS
jgi:DME family drug/metabolite transporter